MKLYLVRHGESECNVQRRLYGHTDCALTENGCRINPVKPRQCRDFPNKWNFPGWRELCRAQEVNQTPDPR